MHLSVSQTAILTAALAASVLGAPVSSLPSHHKFPPMTAIQDASASTTTSVSYAVPVNDAASSPIVTSVAAWPEDPDVIHPFRRLTAIDPAERDTGRYFEILHNYGHKQEDKNFQETKIPPSISDGPGLVVPSNDQINVAKTAENGDNQGQRAEVGPFIFNVPGLVIPGGSQIDAVKPVEDSNRQGQQTEAIPSIFNNIGPVIPSEGQIDAVKPVEDNTLQEKHEDDIAIEGRATSFATAAPEVDARVTFSRGTGNSEQHRELDSGDYAMLAGSTQLVPPNTDAQPDSNDPESEYFSEVDWDDLLDKVFDQLPGNGQGLEDLYENGLFYERQLASLMRQARGATRRDVPQAYPSSEPSKGPGMAGKPKISVNLEELNKKGA